MTKPMQTNPHPPNLSHRFFRWYCKPRLLTGIEGDLLELYTERHAKNGKTRADLRFSIDVIRLFRPGIIRSFKRPQSLNNKDMFKSYLKIGWRNLLRNKTYTALNITGLAVGIASCLLIFWIIRFETSFDNFHPNADRIFRVVSATRTPNGMIYGRSNAFPIARALRLDYPQLKQVAKLWQEDGSQVTVMNDKNSSSKKKFKEDDLFFADPAFFHIFNFPLLAGNAETALAAPNSVLISQKTAEKYFGDWHNAVNGYVRLGSTTICKVTGILKNIPDNSDFPLELVFSAQTSRNDTSTDFVSQRGNLNTFVVLPRNTLAGQFDRELERFVKKYTPPEYANQGYILQPLNDIHYNSTFGNYKSTTFTRQLLTTISLIGFFLLIIACVNFINLSSAQAINRAKEVGVRKVMGSRKTQLIAQFLCETLLIALAAVSLAVVVASFALPLLNNLLHITVRPVFDLSGIAFLVAGVVAITLLSGFYPAMILSRFKPITVLKARLTGKMAGSLTMRRVLVVFQYTIAQGLIIATLVVLSQMYFFRNAPMGFDKGAVVNVPLPNDSLSQLKLAALKEELLQQPGISHVSFSIFTPADDSHWGSDFRFDNSVKNSDFPADLKWADADYFSLYNIRFIAGHPYKEADTVTGFVINKLLAAKLGYPDPTTIIGKKISFWDGSPSGPIVGVVEDFHTSTLAKPMRPMVLGSLQSTYQVANIKLQSTDAHQTLAGIEKLWTRTFPNLIYEYQFLDDKIASFYAQDEQVAQLYKAFAVIAIFISCLGLYGLVSFMAVQRTKEVGIRKVLGASVGNILYLFSKEFTLLIGLAFIISAPVAYYLMHQWLLNFAYRITMGPGLFLMTIAMAIAIAWMAVGYQAIKASLAKPVNSLRTE
jgi:putative ABC transport system permease protein